MRRLYKKPGGKFGGTEKATMWGRKGCRVIEERATTVRGGLHRKREKNSPKSIATREPGGGGRRGDILTAVKGTELVDSPSFGSIKGK